MSPEDEKRTQELQQRHLRAVERQAAALELIARNSATSSSAFDKLRHWWNPDPSSCMRIRR